MGEEVLFGGFGAHQTLNEAHLLGHGQGRDGVVQEHRQEFGVQPLLTSAVAAAAAVARRSTNNGGLGQSQHSERWMDGEDRPEKSPESIKYTHVNVFFFVEADPNLIMINHIVTLREVA